MALFAPAIGVGASSVSFRVCTSSSATRANFVWLSCETRRSTWKAWSPSREYRSINMPWAWPMTVRLSALVRNSSAFCVSATATATWAAK